MPIDADLSAEIEPLSVNFTAIFFPSIQIDEMPTGIAIDRAVDHAVIRIDLIEEITWSNVRITTR